MLRVGLEGACFAAMMKMSDSRQRGYAMMSHVLSQRLARTVRVACRPHSAGAQRGRSRSASPQCDKACPLSAETLTWRTLSCSYLATLLFRPACSRCRAARHRITCISCCLVQLVTCHTIEGLMSACSAAMMT